MLFNLLESETPQQTTGWQTYVIYGFLLLMIVLLVVTSVRSRKKQEKEMREKLEGLKVGDRVKTIGLICGIVVAVNNDENTFVLETGKDNHGTFIKFDKSAIYQIASKKDDKKVQSEQVEEPVSELPTEDAFSEIENANQEKSE